MAATGLRRWPSHQQSTKNANRAAPGGRWRPGVRRERPVDSVTLPEEMAVQALAAGGIRWPGSVYGVHRASGAIAARSSCDSHQRPACGLLAELSSRGARTGLY